MRRILVVDDSEDVRQAMCEVLELGGYETRAVADGASAIDAVAAFHPEVVLLDLGLPGLDGFEVATRLRDLTGGKDLFIIAISGWGAPEIIARTRQAGFDMHLLKPVGMRAIRAILDPLAM